MAPNAQPKLQSLQRAGVTGRARKVPAKGSERVAAECYAVAT